MNPMINVVLLVVVVLGFGGIIWAMQRSRTNPDQVLNQLLERNEQQRLAHKGEVDSSIKSMLGENQEKIDLIVRELRRQLTDSQGDIKSLKEQNVALKEHLGQSLQVTKELQVSTEGLKNLLSNNRLRGDNTGFGVI